jgi:hypothetical protein
MSSLILGWQVTPAGEPRYWLNTSKKPGSQPPSELVRVPAQAMGTHTVIIAQSGSGKSFFLGRLIEELALHRACRVMEVGDNGQRFQPKEHQILFLG